MRDPFGRTLAQSINGTLKTSWSYDAGGNITAIEQGGTKHFRYDALHRCIEKIDEEGNQTLITYEKGFKILTQRVIDPLNIESVQIYNTKNQLLKKKISDQTVKKCAYDALYRIIREDSFHFDYTPHGEVQSIQEAGARITSWRYTSGHLKSAKQKPDGTLLLFSYNEQHLPIKIGSREFCYDELGRLTGGSGFSRTLDPFGNILREEWSNGLWIETDYDDCDRPLVRRLPDHSQIEYDYQGPFLQKVSRISAEGEELYSHRYDNYDAKGSPHLEQGAFCTFYEYDQSGRRISQKNPYCTETVEYDSAGNVIRNGYTVYLYDSLSQMISESDRFIACYDARCNLRELNGQSIKVDSLNQITGWHYDLNGNLLKEGFVYDEFDQLIEAGKENYIYDALGRRIQKGKTAFLYIGDEEIGSFEQGVAKELKVPGLKYPIAVEINQTPYVPVIDVQGVIRALIAWDTKKFFRTNLCDTFGNGLSAAIPYAYMSKRYDADTGLIYFGKRYYDPSLRRWLTHDPMGSADHSNLYQYLFNNPLRSQDPNEDEWKLLPKI